MKRLSLKVLVLLACFGVGLIAVAAWDSFREHRENQTALMTIDDSVPPINTSCVRPLRSEIQWVDFLNFTYPNLSRGYRELGDTIPLRRSQFELYGPGPIWFVSTSPGAITLADITNDGEEEAIIVMFSQSSPSGGQHFIYVYTMKNGKPEFLWFFETYASGSDNGGLRTLNEKNGNLVLELNGKNRILENRAEAEPAACDVCYQHLTRVSFRWNGKSFVRTGKVEILPLPDAQD